MRQAGHYLGRYILLNSAPCLSRLGRVLRNQLLQISGLDGWQDISILDRFIVVDD